MLRIPTSTECETQQIHEYNHDSDTGFMLGGTMIDAPRVEEVPASKMGAAGTEDINHSPDIRRVMYFLGAAYFFIMTMVVLPIACVTTVLIFSPLYYIRKDLFIRVENFLCKMVNDHWVATSWYTGMSVVEYGQDVKEFEDKRCMLLANHLGLLDHFVLMQSLHNKGAVSGSWMWVIYNIWKYTPLGAMWTSHGNFFVNGGASQRVAVLETFKEHLKSKFWDMEYRWVVMYPEGSRFFLIKDSSARWAEKNGLPALKHCALPRSGAAHAVLAVAAPKKDGSDESVSGCGAPIKYIIDATIGYPKGDVADLSSAVLNEWPHPESPRVSVHYEMIPVKAEWTDESKLLEFLYERYKIKDALLDEFYKTGRFPGEGRTVNIIQSTIVFSQIFWLCLYYVHHLVWIRPLWYGFWAYFFSFF